jgi:hypothetical protein
MRTRRLITGLGLVALLSGGIAATQVGTAPAAEAFVKLGCRYSGTNPTLYYQIGSLVTSVRRTATGGGAARWNTVAVPGTFVAWTPGKPVNVAVTEWSSVDAYEAETTGTCSRGFWSGSKTTLTWNSPSPGGLSGNATAMRMVATHELGHSYGLGHMKTTCSGTRTVMVQGSTKWSCNWGTEPWTDDINGVNAIY